jgi:hypothetical protein
MKILLKLTVVKDMKVLDGSNDQLVSNVFFLVIRAVFTTALIFRF